MAIIKALRKSLSKVIANALGEFFVVVEDDIETELIAHNGRIKLQNVKIKEYKIPMSLQAGGVTCFLVILGSSYAEEFSLEWAWASHQDENASLMKTDLLLEDVILTLRGVKVFCSFQFEKEDTPRTFGTRTKAPWEQEKKEGTSPQGNFVSRYVKEEMQRLKRAVISNVMESKTMKQVFRDAVDSASTHVIDLSIEMRAPFTGCSIKIGVESFHVISKNKELGPLMLNVTWKSLFADLHINKKRKGATKGAATWVAVFPILEPFHYKATIRRTDTTRFVSWHHGCEIIGMGDYADSQATRNTGRGNGIIIHHSDDISRALSQLKEAIQGIPSEPDYDAGLYDTHEQESAIGPWPVSARVLLLILCLFSIVSAMILIWFPLKFLGLRSRLLAEGLWITGFLLFAAATVYLTTADLDNYDEKVAMLSQDRLQHEKLEEHLSSFRLPLPYISVVSKGDFRFTFSNITLMGRSDFSKIYISAKAFNAKSKGSSRTGIRVSMSDIRAIYNRRGFLVNVDQIHSAHIPGVIHLNQPLEYSVFFLENGRLNVKFKSFHAQLLSPKQDADVIRDENQVKQDLIASTIRKTGETVNKTEKKIKERMQEGLDSLKKKEKKEKEEAITDPAEIAARNRFNAEIYERLVKLQVLGRMFEQIPLKNNRENLRLYPNSFRGKDGVDFVLENDMAANRPEAVRLLKSLEIDFGLFESVTREYKFRDDHGCLYRFLPHSKRRFWKKEDLPYDWVETFDRKPQQSLIPFPISLRCADIFLNKVDKDGNDSFVAVSNAEIYLETGTISSAIETTVFAGELKTSMVALSNARVHFIIDPAVPRLAHRLQISLDFLRVNPDYSVEDWFDYLGVLIEGDDDTAKSERQSTVSEPPSSPYSLPYAYVSDFQLVLSWKGVVLSSKEKCTKVFTYAGDASTTATELIKEFIIHVLGKAPGMLTGMQFFGVGLFESAGIAAAMNVGAKFVPGGEFISIGFMAMYDGICSTLDAGKAARYDPTGKYKPGDFVRGIFYSANETARTGAELRGKSVDDFYDEDDKVRYDPKDLAAGVAYNAYHYSKDNKARFAGAFTAAAVTIGTTVVLGPVGGIAIGIVAGAGTEFTINQVEKNVVPMVAELGEKIKHKMKKTKSEGYSSDSEM